MALIALTLDEVGEVSARMGSGATGGLEDLLAELGGLETLKHAIEARQAVLAVHVDQAMRERAAGRGEPAARQGRGVGEAVAAARRISPAQGRVVVAMAQHVRRMPALLRRFNDGAISEHKAVLLSREASVLGRGGQRIFDQEMAATAGLADLGTRKLLRRAQTIVLGLDESAAVRRRELSCADRHVRVRPTDRGDGMAWLTALLPVEQAAAVKDALDRAADVLIAAGSATSRGQAMADTLVVRLTEDSNALGGREPTHPIRVNLIMTDTSLLDLGSEPAIVSGHGPIPAATARRMIRMAEDDHQAVELRRLYTEPATGELVTMESRARRFPPGLTSFIRLRDQLCRTPACGARISHIDHHDDWANGGATSARNGQGLCAQCNWAAQVIAKPDTTPRPLHRPRPSVRRVPRLDVCYRSAA